MKSTPIPLSNGTAGFEASQATSGQASSAATPNDRRHALRSNKFDHLQNTPKKLPEKNLEHAFSSPNNTGNDATHSCSSVNGQYSANSQSVRHSQSTANKPLASTTKPQIAATQTASAAPKPVALSHLLATIPLMRLGMGVEESDYSTGKYPITFSLNFQNKERKKLMRPRRHDPYSVVNARDPEEEEAAALARAEEAKNLTAQEYQALQDARRADQQAEAAAQEEEDRFEQQQEESLQAQAAADYIQSQGY